ncbi:hypothetical protein Bhyg_07452 [Pseudolycoriella hygida]|uniref:Uncharacterized protein n=1 Tax=Pseudolycoriella hygida TaxID=35572 RepID=A0A9Q0N3Z9_9DIPT|nr:hypothetical protein Bhyg_07452 [Pseudolycoriella hygida]
MENNVEVIEIDDDDDNELSCPIPEKAIEHTNMNVPTSPTKREPQKPVMNVKSGQQYPWYAIQQLVINNHPDVELRKTKLDWKSDQFRLIYIKGENQNVHTCTKCWELFYDINVDTIVRHTRCRPVPRVPRGAKRKMFKDSHKDTKLQEDKPATVQNVVMSKIQTLASCMDVQPSTFYQSKRFLQFAQFLIDTGAKIASSTINKSEFAYEPNQNVLCSFKDQLKDNQLTKISAILNTPNSDYSLSCEVWEDCCRGMSNVALELHYLDTNFRPHKIVIGVRSIVGTTVDNAAICDKILDILRIYSKKNNGTEFLENSIAFVTSRKLYSQSLGVVSFPSACSVINCIADAIVNEPKLKLAEQCLDVIEWLNGVSMERITTFDARHWKNIYELFQKMIGKRNCFAQRQVETDFKQDDSIMEILEPFYHAILKLSGPGNNITKVFAVFKTLERSLMPLETDEELIKAIKTKALEHLRIAFSKSDTYQISMFLDLTNRDQYNSLQSEEIDSLQSKIDSMINPYASTVENGCVENNLLDYMDDNVTSQKNQVDQFLQLSMPKEEDPYEFWRHNKQMTGLKAIARKYLTIPTYASLSECIRTESIKEFLGKRSKLEVKDLETVLMMNSYQSELHKPKNWNILQLNKC